MSHHDFHPGLQKILGAAAPTIEASELAGGASNRRYFRVQSPDQSWVVMVLADEPLRSEEAVSGPAVTELPFVSVQRFLSDGGIAVPRIHLFDETAGHLWLDDLGDVVLGDQLLVANPEERVRRYCDAVDLLVAFQQATQGERTSPICYQRRFEASLLRWELDHYVEWRVETQLGKCLTEDEKTHIGSLFDQLVSRLLAEPQVLCHRDFQSRNLMVQADNSLVLIDFQDALMGPYCYDLVALTRDSYVQLSFDEVSQIIDYYLGLRPDLDGTAFRSAFHCQTIQRKLKDAGRFVYIERVKHDASFLQYIRPSLTYVRDALAHAPGMEELALVLARLDPEAFA